MFGEFLKISMSEARAQRIARKEETRRRIFLAQLDERSRRGRRAWAIASLPSDQSSARDFCKREKLYFDGVVSVERLPQFLELIEQGRDVDHVILAHSEIGLSDLISLLWATQSNGAAVHSVGQLNLIQRILISLLSSQSRKN